AREPALAAHARWRCQVHRLLDPHHAGGRAALRRRRRRRPRPHRRDRHGRRAAREDRPARLRGGLRRARVRRRTRRRGADGVKRSIGAVAIVLRKELRDALRDRRTLMTVLVSAVLMGPLVLLAISGFVASLEARAEQREVVVAGIAHAPTLRNYLERQTYGVKEAPPDFEAQLRRSALH